MTEPLTEKQVADIAALQVRISLKDQMKPWIDECVSAEGGLLLACAQIMRYVGTPYSREVAKSMAEAFKKRALEMEQKPQGPWGIGMGQLPADNTPEANKDIDLTV